MSIGQRIRTEREKQGLELKQLAELSNIPERTLGDIERGKSNPRSDNLQKIIITLGCSADKIMFDDDQITGDAEIDVLMRELKKARESSQETAKEVLKALLIKSRIDDLDGR